MTWLHLLAWLIHAQHVTVQIHAGQSKAFQISGILSLCYPFRDSLLCDCEMTVNTDSCGFCHLIQEFLHLNGHQIHPGHYSVQFSSVAQSCPILCDPVDCSVPDFLFLHYLPEFAQTHVHWLSDGWMNHFILYRPLPLLPSIFPNINVFSNELALQIRRRKCWNFGFNISPSNEYSELISFRSDWFDLLAVQGALMCLLQHHRSKASVLQCSAFFMVQLWHLYMTTRKTVTLCIGTFVNKVMSLLSDTLSRFGIVFFPRASAF